MYGGNNCRCRLCGINPVEYEGAICQNCALGKNPGSSAGGNDYGSGYGGNSYGSAGGNDYGNSYGGNSYGSPSGDSGYMGGGGYAPGGNSYGMPEPGYAPSSGAADDLGPYTPGQFAPPSKNEVGHKTANGALDFLRNGQDPTVEGVARNISIGHQKRLKLVKFFKSVFTGVPYSRDHYLTNFQVFPDVTRGNSTQGYICDQVIVYGKLNAGMISENNEVQVHGHRDSDGNIIAKKIINRSTGTRVTPQHTVPAFFIRLLAVLMLLFIAVMTAGMGMEGLLYALVMIVCLANLPTVFKLMFKLIKFVLSIAFH